MRTWIYFFAIAVYCMQALSASTTSVRLAWISRLPYSYYVNSHNVSQLKGLDVDFARLISKRLGLTVKLIQVQESELDQLIKDKKIDGVLGFSKENFSTMLWSVPYRQETYVAYLAPVLKDFYYTPEELLKTISQHHPLGVVSNHYRVDAHLKKFVTDPKNQNKVFVLDSETEVLEKFLQGYFSVFVGDRVVFSTLLHRVNQWRQVREVSLDLNQDISLGIVQGGALDSYEEKINTQIDLMKKEGVLDRLFSEYLTPAVLMHTIDEGWLRFIEFLGVIAFTVYAFIHGFYRHMAFVKTIGFSMIVVFAGPVLKDILSTGQIEFFRNPHYISTVIGVVFVAHAIISMLRNLSYKQIRTYIFSENKDHWIQEIACAVGLSSYTVSGVLYAITSTETSWFWEGVLGTITATSGLLIAHELYKLPSKIKFLFSEISFVWGTLLALYFSLSRSAIDFEQDSIFLAVLIVFFGVFLSRMMAIYHELSSIGFGRKLQETINRL